MWEQQLNYHIQHGASPNYISRSTLDDGTLGTGSQQLKIVGVSRDPDNN